MTASTEQERTEFEDGAWYWVEFPSFRSGKHVAPAMYKANCDSWYSYEYSGHSTRFVKVLEPCLMQAARRTPVVPQGWKLVPEEATFGMLNAMHGICGENGKARQSKIDEADRKYAAMLAAAPQPPACNQSMQPTADHFPAVGQMVAQRIYTYKQQPTDNVAAWRFGEACSSAKPGGDYIDRGLSLLQQLEKKGYGIAELKK